MQLYELPLLLMPRCQNFGEVKVDEPLALHTTLGVGGPAARLVTATSVEQLQEGIRLASHFNIPFCLGWGSNLIISDRGFAGVVIKSRPALQIISESSATTPSTQLTAPRLAPPEKVIIASTI
jgi:UDP-N-acetylenolpyruvoylglucosamine reductase